MLWPPRRKSLPSARSALPKPRPFKPKRLPHCHLCARPKRTSRRRCSGFYMNATASTRKKRARAKRRSGFVSASDRPSRISPMNALWNRTRVPRSAISRRNPPSCREPMATPEQHLLKRHAGAEAETQEVPDQRAAESRVEAARAAAAQARAAMDAAEARVSGAIVAEAVARTPVERLESEVQRLSAESRALANLLRPDSDLWPPLVDSLTAQPRYESALAPA